MSTRPDQPRTYRCEAADCDGERTPATSVRGSYCSDACFYRDRGRDFLRNFTHDHRWCGACFRQLKEVSRPSDDDLRAADPIAAECIVGYQYLTAAADIGQRELRGLDSDADRAPSDSLVTTGTCCDACGTTDHRDDYLRDSLTPSGVARRLLAAVEHTGHEGQHDKMLDASVFVQTLKETNCDWTLAVGRALTDA